MNIKIDKFKPEQYAMVRSWWDNAKEIAPELKLMPETSYILSYEGTPVLSVSLFLTNGSLAWVENFIGNPEFKGNLRKQLGKMLLNHLEGVAKENKKDRLFCMSMNEKTTKRYIELGFIKTVENITCFTKGVE